MKPNKIINLLASTVGLILFGYYKSYSKIPLLYKKVTVDDYKLFLERATCNSFDELTKPQFIDGSVEVKSPLNTKIISDLNHIDKIPMSLIQKKSEFEYWIKFEQKDGFIKYINISTGDNFKLVIYNIILTTALIYTSVSFNINLLIALWIITTMRLYTFLTICNSITFLKLHLEYLYKIYLIRINDNL